MIFCPLSIVSPPFPTVSRVDNSFSPPFKEYNIPIPTVPKSERLSCHHVCDEVVPTIRMFNLYLVIMRKRTFIIYNRSQRDSQSTSSIKEITYRYDQCGYYNLIDIARSSKRIIYYGILYKTDSCDAFCTFYSILFCRQCCSWIEKENSQLIGHYFYVI